MILVANKCDDPYHVRMICTSKPVRFDFIFFCRKYQLKKANHLQMNGEYHSFQFLQSLDRMCKNHSTGF